MSKCPQVEGLNFYPDKIILNQGRKKRISATGLYIAEQFARQFDGLLFNAIIGKLENKSRKILYPEK